MNRELQIIKEVEPFYGAYHKRYKQVEVKCFCGNTFVTLLRNIVTKEVKSCGCIRPRKSSGKQRSLYKSHDLSKHKLYNVWQSMKGRCLNEDNPNYFNYGGRGIRIYKSWLDIKTFVDWATNNGYEEGLTIDRINVNGNYEPGNCRWVTMKEQANNKRNTVLVDYNGESKSRYEWLQIMSAKYGEAFNAFRDLGFLKETLPNLN